MTKAAPSKIQRSWKALTVWHTPITDEEAQWAPLPT
jgi:hypothetical protein